MKKINQRSKKKAVVGYDTNKAISFVAAITLVLQSFLPSAALAVNELTPVEWWTPSFQLEQNTTDVEYDSDTDTFEVLVTGTAVSSMGGSNAPGHYIQVNWGDGSPERRSNSFAYGSGVLDAIIGDGDGGLVGPWNGTHTYDAPGTYDVVVEWYYNPDQPNVGPINAPLLDNPGNDIIRARMTLQVVVAEELPGTLTGEQVVMCVDDEGAYQVQIEGEASLAPFTWSSLGYYVNVNWGDGTEAQSDTPDSGVSDDFRTEDTGKSLTGEYEATHTYANEGSYDVVIDLFYNPNQPHTTPVKVPSTNEPENDVHNATVTVAVDTSTAGPCNPPNDEDDLPGDLSGDVVTMCVDDGGEYQVAIEGEGYLAPFTWSSLGYYVNVNWGDTTEDQSNTPGGNATDTFHTPDYGKSLVGGYEATHAYSAEGTYDIVVDMFYNPNQPHTTPVKVPATNDPSNDVRNATVTLSVNTENAEPCNPPADEPELPGDLSGEIVTMCVDDSGTHVELAGEGSLAPFTWSSLGYYIQVAWGDGSTADSDTPGSDASDTFHTPDYGKSLGGTWEAEHLYTTDGTYNVDVRLYYNPNQPHTPPVKIPATSQPANDELVAMATIPVNTANAADCAPQQQGSATITIQKVWEPAEGDHPTPSILLEGGEVELNTEYTRFAPAVYSLAEEPIDGYTTSVSCSDGVYTAEQQQIWLDDGDDAVCTFTNTKITGTSTLEIVKVWEFSTTSTPVYPEFTIALDGNVVITSSTGFTVDGLVINEGTHTIAENLEANFTTTVACQGDEGAIAVTEGAFTAEANDNIICTVTNTEVVETPSDENDNNGGGDDPAVQLQAFGGGGGGGNLSANNAVGGGSLGGPAPAVLGIQDTAETLLTCAEQYPEAALIAGDLDDLLAAYGFTRNTDRETGIGAALFGKIIPESLTLGNANTISNFIVYGIQSLWRLGAGERAGLIASFHRLYNTYPQNECDWQNVIRMGQGVTPVVVATDAEAAATTAFEEIYDRAPNMDTAQDKLTVLIMAYGLRPDVRSLSAEIQANGIFRSIYGHFPRTTAEWDIMRGIAYGGLTVPGFSPIVR